MPTRCRNHGPTIRFPFRIKEHQPKHCGYPGFDLSCTDQSKHPVLELPFSVNVSVNKINYTSQIIYVSKPHGCFPRLFPNLSLISPFQFAIDYDYHHLYYDEFSFLNCSKSRLPPGGKAYYGIQISCLGDPTHKVYAQYSSDSPKLPCRKMYDMTLPWAVLDNLTFGILPLNWTKPACGNCEAGGKYCRMKNNSTEHETECFDKPKLPTKGTILAVSSFLLLLDYLQNKSHIGTDVLATHAETSLNFHKLGSVTSLQTFFTDPTRKLKVAGLVLGLSLFVVAVVAIYLTYRSSKIKKEDQVKITKFLEDYEALKPSRYSYADIKKITNQFQDKVGEGGFGTVYKGKLSSDVHVAVKILNCVKGNGDEFINEVGTMGRIHHINVVRLVGYCADGFRRALLYEFLPNKSLEKFTTSDHERNSLGWEKLQDIALGIAKGIEYLHVGCDQRIVHFDIKPHNILLDHKFNPKISDFGLAKLCSKEQSAVSMTAARGTVGYIAPEVFSRNFGKVSYKSDVYSFGMLLLDMVGGRKNTAAQDRSQAYFPEWIYNRLDQGVELGIQIEDDGDAKIVRKLTIIGLWCIQWYPMDRPSMKVVVEMMEGDGGTLTVPPSPFGSTNPEATRGTMGGRSFNSELTVISESE
ncbi:rust resistance kinase Lr10-like [Actinidia eriantha]|uniref:rust resistance kinase Lr10-like n=1 Tax=Actinidia eriantha TaxID=165200 RepID=UPI00258D0DD1|nr:rust resistance kinase Lr10-like [Actinidia eriantha]